MRNHVHTEMNENTSFIFTQKSEEGKYTPQKAKKCSIDKTGTSIHEFHLVQLIELRF
jgi:hypothetical protein